MPTDKKISELPIATSINASDISVLVDSGTDYQYTFTLLLQFLEANLTTGASISFGTVLPQNTAGSDGDVFVNTSVGSFAQKLSGTWTIVYSLPAANAADGTLLYGAGLPGTTTGKNADSYINTLTGIFYQKTVDAWSQVFSMATGPQGPQGMAGINGTNGINGNTILYGTVDPSNTSTGIDGNFYINTSNYTIFGPKVAGVWPTGVSILGSPGAAGSTGSAGPPGEGLATGGTTGQVLAKNSNANYDAGWINPPSGGGVGIPSVSSGEKVVTQKSDGTHVDYDLAVQIISSSSLTSADFSSGAATVTGLVGQLAYDSTFRYECIGINQWIRQVINNNLIDLYLADIDDSLGDKTSVQLQNIYPSSLPGQQVFGINRLYIKKTSTGWKKISIADA